MNKLEHGWYNGSRANYLLMPLTIIFSVVSHIRRACYRVGLFKTIKVAKPLVIVGNISVGGNGKTPFVIWAANILTQNNIKVGIISRGYGGYSREYPVAVDDTLNTKKFGDEPVLLYRRTGCPVVVGPDRVKNCELLIKNYQCDVILSDDGLQHYRIQRDVEVAIVDSKRLFGNGWLLPVGPLRERVKRLKKVDYVIYNGKTDKGRFFELNPSAPRQVKPSETNRETFGHQAVQLVCAIGNPERFKQTVTDRKIAIESFTPFGDHHQFTEQDFNHFGDKQVLMTEKDAVKCTKFAKPNWWYLPVDAWLPEPFEQEFLSKIQQVIKNHGI